MSSTNLLMKPSVASMTSADHRQKPSTQRHERMRPVAARWRFCDAHNGGVDEADLIWNRAALDDGGASPGAGDMALAAVLAFHGLAMSVVRQEHGTAVSPVAWDRPGPGSAVAVADDYGLVWRGSSGWLFRQWHGTTVGAIFSVGHPLGAAVGSPGAARVCPQGRAERALVVPGGSGAGFAARPGRSLGASLREGRGCGGGAPAVGGGREGVMVAGRRGGWRVFAGAGRTRRR